MLRFVHTDLFNSSAQTLVNTVNTVGVMGKEARAQVKNHDKKRTEFSPT